MVYVDRHLETRYVYLGSPPKLPEDAKKIVDDVVEKFGRRPLEHLLAEVYRIIGGAELGEEVLEKATWRLKTAELLAACDDDAAREFYGRLYEAYRTQMENISTLISLHLAAVATLCAEDKKGEVG